MLARNDSATVNVAVVKLGMYGNTVAPMVTVLLWLQFFREAVLSRRGRDENVMVQAVVEGAQMRP